MPVCYVTSSPIYLMCQYTRTFLSSFVDTMHLHHKLLGMRVHLYRRSLNGTSRAMPTLTICHLVLKVIIGCIVQSKSFMVLLCSPIIHLVQAGIEPTVLWSKIRFLKSQNHPWSNTKKKDSIGPSERHTHLFEKKGQA